MGRAYTRQPDEVFGAWVYCKSHVGPHETGWCSVGLDNKIALKATNRQDAMAESWAMGFRIFGYCDSCHAWIANEAIHACANESPDGRSPSHKKEDVS